MPKDVERSQIIPPPHREAMQEAERDPGFREPRLRRRRTGLFVSLALVTLAAIVVLAGLLMHFATRGLLVPGRQAIVPAGPLGPFVEPPYNASQVNALWHLADRMTYRELAYLYVARMSLAEKLGQMIMTESEQNAYSDDLDYMITQLHVGGMIMYDSHLQTTSQARATTSLAQQRAQIPLLISVDEEGGAYVNRLKHIYGARPGPWEIYQKGSLSFARQQGVKMAHDLLSIGLNTDLAPDVDVMIVPGIDTAGRTFGTTAAAVIKYAAPYKTFINSPNPLMQPAMIMSTDVLMPAIDPKMPAELSHIFMTDILRKEFGYDGVVLTDALYMGGISARWSEPQAAVLAIQAGNDMILGPMGSARTAAVIEALKQALHDGRLSMARVNEAVTRIIALKMQYHLMPVTLPQK